MEAGQASEQHSLRTPRLRPPAPRRRQTSSTRLSRSPRGTPRRAGPAPGSISTPGAPAPVLNRGVPRTGRRRRAPVDRGCAWKAFASPPRRIARPELRQGVVSALRPVVWRLAALRDRYRPISRPARLWHDQFLGSPRGRPFRAQFFAAARRAGPVSVQR